MSGRERSDPALRAGSERVSLYGPGVVVRLLAAGLLAVATELAGIGLIGTATWMIVRAAEQPPMAALAVAIAAVRGFALVKGGLRYAERLAGHDAVLRVLADLRARTFAALTVGRRPRAADALSRVVSDVDGVQDVLLRAALPAGVAAVVGVLAVVGTTIAAPLAGVLLAAGLLAGGVLLPLLGYARARAGAGQIATARGAATTATVDVVHGVADLTAYGALPTALADASTRAHRLAALEARAGTVAGVVGGLAAAVPALTALAVVSVTGGRGAAVLALVALATGEVVVPLAVAAVRHAELRGGLTRVRELLGAAEVASPPTALSPVCPDVTAPSARDEERRPHPGPVHLRLSDAVVQYDGVPALNGVTLDLPPGARVAVTGPSGSGKSTLLAALAGQVRLSAGSRIGAPSGTQPWQVAGGVFADAHVFHATVRENLTLGREWLTDDDLRRALADAGLDDYADRLDEVVGEDGARLSGGQRQRLLLARALTDPPPVLLLDEPTEGLDAVAADAVLGTALKAAGERTVVVVTHRDVELDRFDAVVRIERGRRA